MNIAEQLIMRQHIEPDRDELGLPLPEDPENPPLDYVVARILTRNPRLYQNKDGTIGLGSSKIKENADNVVLLSNSYSVLTRGARCQLVWNRLRDVLPVFDDSKLWIAPGLLWDMRECDFVEQEPKDNHI